MEFSITTKYMIVRLYDDTLLLRMVPYCTTSVLSVCYHRLSVLLFCNVPFPTAEHEVTYWLSSQVRGINSDHACITQLSVVDSRHQHNAPVCVGCRSLVRELKHTIRRQREAENIPAVSLGRPPYHRVNAASDESAASLLSGF